MKNRLFRASKRLKKHRKLDVTLRKFTDDRLTVEQRRIISLALDRRPQHSVQVYRTAETFRTAVKDGAGDAEVQMLFGCIDDQVDEPAAALVCQTVPQRTLNAVCIYLPTEMEEKRDDPR